MASKRKSFRIVHLSDLHLTARDDAKRSEPKLFGQLRGMNEAFRSLLRAPAVRKADLILVTGDVTDRGDLEAWRVFWNALEDVDALAKVLVVPGNHDVCCLGARMPLNGAGYSDEDLKKALDGLKLGGAKQVKFPWVEQPDDRVAVIGLNSNNLGNFTAATNAMGSLNLFQLSSLASKLHVIRNVPVKILALHHSPNIPSEEVEIKRGLRPFTKLDRIGHQIDAVGASGLQLLGITHRVRLILHGHLHRAEVRRVAGVKIVGAPASTQPLSLEGGGQGLPFFQHTVLGNGGRVETKLELA